jgi:membrane dipeptidase
MQEGGLDGVFFAVFVGQGPRTAGEYEKAKSEALMLFDSIHSAVGRCTVMAAIALRADDLKTLSRRGKKAVYIGMENGYPLGKDLSLVNRFYELGARYITLCHSENNDICDSSTDRDGPEHGGLSDFGRSVVAEMNRLGIMIDVSHMSDEAFDDVMETSRSPVIASHSNARAICDNPRNLSDDMLRKLAENGGVIQLCLVSDYIARMPAYPERDSARKALWAKYENWSELDESSKLALEDCFDVTELPAITRELQRRGYSRSDLQKFWSGILLRVMREVEKKAG